MTPDEDNIGTYDHFREAYGWLPSEVDDQDALIMDKLMVIDIHREAIRRAKRKQS